MSECPDMARITAVAPSAMRRDSMKPGSRSPSGASECTARRSPRVSPSRDRGSRCAAVRSGDFSPQAAPVAVLTSISISRRQRSRSSRAGDRRQRSSPRARRFIMSSVIGGLFRKVDVATRPYRKAPMTTALPRYTTPLSVIAVGASRILGGKFPNLTMSMNRSALQAPEEELP